MQLSRNTVLCWLTVLAVAAFGMLLFSHKMADVDLWGNLGFVDSPPWSDSFLKVNTYSFTEPEHPWTNHEWLAEYILNGIYRSGGSRLLLVFKTAIGLLLTLLLFLTLKRTCQSASIQLFFLLLVMSTIGYGFSTRPHLFTYLMFTLLLMSLCFRPGILPYAALPAGILWTNLHGAFFIGIVTIGAFLAGRLIDGRTHDSGKDLKCIFVSLAILIFASFINPYGSGIWTFISESAGKTRTYLSEWAPFHPVRDFADHSDFIALSVISMAAAFSTRKHSLKWLIPGILAFTAAMIMRRNIPLFAIVSVFSFAPLADRKFGHHLDALIVKTPYALKIAALVLILASSGGALAKTHRQHGFRIDIDTYKFPVGCVEFIKEHQLNGNMLAFFDWAEYCIWELYPDTKVFLDGRYKSAYSSETIDTFDNFIYGRKGWTRALEDFPTTMVLIHKGNPAYRNMLTREDWTLACTDTAAGLFLKNAAFAEQLSALQGLPHAVMMEQYAVFK